LSTIEDVEHSLRPITSKLADIASNGLNAAKLSNTLQAKIASAVNLRKLLETISKECKAVITINYFIASSLTKFVFQ
jgi:hypothetical protein